MPAREWRERVPHAKGTRSGALDQRERRTSGLTRRVPHMVAVPEGRGTRRSRVGWASADARHGRCAGVGLYDGISYSRSREGNRDDSCHAINRAAQRK
jgi:hypothetical protein